MIIESISCHGSSVIDTLMVPVTGTGAVPATSDEPPLPQPAISARDARGNTIAFDRLITWGLLMIR